MRISGLINLRLSPETGAAQFVGNPWRNKYLDYLSTCFFLSLLLPTSFPVLPLCMSTKIDMDKPQLDAAALQIFITNITTSCASSPWMSCCLAQPATYRLEGCQSLLWWTFRFRLNWERNNRLCLVFSSALPPQILRLTTHIYAKKGTVIGKERITNYHTNINLKIFNLARLRHLVVWSRRSLHYQADWRAGADKHTHVGHKTIKSFQVLF